MKKLKFTNSDTADLCRELQFLIHAGIGNSDALYNLMEDETRPEYKKVLEEMANNADNYMTVSEAFRASGCIDEYVCEMVSVGEQTGKMEDALRSVADWCDSRASLDRSLKSALIYPSVLFLIMLAVLAMLLIYVLPIFNDVYSQLGSNLTGLAGGLYNIGRAMKSAGPVLIAILIAVTGFLAAFSASTSFRERITNSLFLKKGNKGIGSKLAYAHFAGALSLGMFSGLGPEESVSGAIKVMGDIPGAKEKLGKCLDLFTNGKSFASALKEAGLLPASQCRMLEAGIKGGAGEVAIEQIAKRMEEEATAAIEDSVSRIEPVMVIIASVLIGIILVAVLMPLVNIMSAIG